MKFFHQYLLAITIQLSSFVDLEKFNPLHEVTHNYNKPQHSPYDPTKVSFFPILHPVADFISICGQISKKTVSFNDIGYFIELENVVTYVQFDCGFTFYLETPTKVGQINRERKNISGTC